jgi:hypothetical protein
MKRRKKKQPDTRPTVAQIAGKTDAARIADLAVQAGGTPDQMAAILMSIGLAAVDGSEDVLSRQVEFIAQCKQAQKLQREADTIAAQARQVRTAARRTLKAESDAGQVTPAGMLARELAADDGPGRTRAVGLTVTAAGPRQKPDPGITVEGPALAGPSGAGCAIPTAAGDDAIENQGTKPARRRKRNTRKEATP